MEIPEIPNNDPSKENSRADFEKRQRQIKVNELREARGWNLLRRQVKLGSTRDGEAWNKHRQQLHDKLGTGFTICLLGGRGVGKTQLAVDLMMVVTERLKTAQYVTATGFFLELKSTFNKESPLSEKDVIEELCRPSFLVVDEYEKRADTDWENRVLFELLNNRYGMMKDTLILSNLKPEGFQAVLGPSMSSRVAETGGIITCDWPSFRK